MSKKAENVIDISLERLLPFQEHPFHVRDDEQMAMIVESIRSVGVLVPAIVRPLEGGFYEIISGHRRKHACELLGLLTLPCIVRDADRDAATCIIAHLEAPIESGFTPENKSNG